MVRAVKLLNGKRYKTFNRKLFKIWVEKLNVGAAFIRCSHKGCPPSLSRRETLINSQGSRYKEKCIDPK
jgi:hypothetical protein